MTSPLKYSIRFLLLAILSLNLQAAPVMISSSWLAEHLNDDNIVIVDMSTDSTQFERFHLPTAQHLPYKYLTKRNKQGVSLRTDDVTLMRIFGVLGISNDTHVIIYDDMAGLDAGRLFWELERIGHPEVSVLKGGLVTWILEGRMVTNQTSKPKQTTYNANKQSNNNEATLDSIQITLKESDRRLIDVRSEPEYIGQIKEPRSGHLPGAIHWPWDQTVDFKKGFISKPSQQLLTSLKTQGIDITTPVTTYCRSGHRAAQSYLSLRAMGFTDVQLYDGSMSEWSQHKNLPITQGKTP